MAVLVVVAAVLVVSYASSMRAYLEQRSHMESLRDRIATSQEDIAALEREKRRWQDEEYVKGQARERFGWVMPGETSYQVLGRDGEPLERSDELTDPDSLASELPDPWWEKVDESLRVADHPERVPRPAVRITPPPVPAPDQ